MIKTSLYALLALLIGHTGICQPKPIVMLSTEKGQSFQVYDDEHLVKTHDGYLLAGKLAKNVVVEEGIDMRPIIPFECNSRQHEISNPVLIAPAGSLISFISWMSNHELHGYLQSMTIGNGKSMLVRCWGLPNGLSLPNGTLLYFQTNIYCKNGEPCAPQGAPIAYWTSRCRYAVLGSDTKLPGLGLVKKGTMVKFTAGEDLSCMESEYSGPGKITPVIEKDKKWLLNDFFYKRNN
jgi:hypothetical protein